MCSIIMCSSSASVLACDLSNDRQAISTESRNIKIYSENTFSSDYYYDELSKIGFTESEMYDLYLKESNKLGMRLMLPNKLSKNIKKRFAYPTKNVMLSNSHIERAGFPSNPQIGKTYEISHTIYMSDLAYAMGYPGGAAGAISYIGSKSKWEVAKGVAKVIGLGGVGAAMGVAGVIVGEVSKWGTDYGIQWTQTWYYGEDNNMSIGWTPGYISSHRWVRR